MRTQRLSRCYLILFQWRYSLLAGMSYYRLHPVCNSWQYWSWSHQAIFPFGGWGRLWNSRVRRPCHKSLKSKLYSEIHSNCIGKGVIQILCDTFLTFFQPSLLHDIFFIFWSLNLGLICLELLNVLEKSIFRTLILLSNITLLFRKHQKLCWC
jgi:hypothetical protein